MDYRINKPVQFYEVVGETVAVWTIANIGYYLILPALGFELSYNSSPVAIAFYFLLWAFASTFIFWDIYSKWFIVKTKIWLYGALSLISTLFVLGIIHVFSSPSVLPSLELSSYTDILFATPWYFLPKSVEILVQQLLITALVLDLYFRFNSLKNVVIGYAMCFGSAHIALFALNGSPVPYSIIMTVGAFLSSFTFPYLILRVKFGFIYAYMIHFLFYICFAMLLHAWPPPGYVI